MQNLRKILIFAFTLPHIKTNYFEGVKRLGKLGILLVSQNHARILYLEHEQNGLFYDVILPLWETKGFASWLTPTAK